MDNHGYCKFDDLDYTPLYGSADVRGNNETWTVPVSIPQGRAMEADGVPVCWVYASVPNWLWYPGLRDIYVALNRIWNLPGLLVMRVRTTRRRDQ